MERLISVLRTRLASLDRHDLLRRFVLIVVGSGILTFGIHNIHQVVGITEGGVIGALLLANHWLGIPSSIVSPVLDILCYAVALRLLGAGFLGWSAVSSAFIAGFYAIWEQLPHLLPDLSDWPLVASVAGGLFVGVGAGLVVRGGASAGGDDALALSIQKVSGWRLSRCYLVTDLSVLLLSLSYIPVTSIVYSLITVFISSPLIDVIVGMGSDEPANEPQVA